MINPCISVIIPVYNVEEYMNRAIDSVINQTYPHIEIILVDDGSKDSSGLICDSYSKADPRIRVIHKENGGLSDARNAGLEVANGEWVLFVDSDDFIPIYACERYLSAIRKADTDVVISRELKFKDEQDCKDASSDSGIKLIESEKALIDTFYRKLPIYAWGKLYRKTLLVDCRFKKGKLFEDIFWTPMILERAKNVLIIDDVLYFYRQRDDSIVHTKFNERWMDALDGVEIMQEHFKNHSTVLRNAIMSKKMIQCIDLLGRAYGFESYGNERKRLIDGINESKMIVLKDKKNSMKVRVAALVAIINPTLLGFVSANREKLSFLIHGRV